MLRAREIANSDSGSRKPKLLFILSLFFALAMGLAAYYKQDGFRALLGIDEKLEKEERVVKRLESENSVLEEKIKSVNDDTYPVEKFAREKLNLVKEDEVVFRFYEKSPTND